MKSTYLIVIDMQNDFIDGSLGTPEAAAIVDRVADKIKTHTGKILYTLDTHGNDYLETIEGIKLPVVHCLQGTEGWQLNVKIEAELKKKNAVPFKKETFGSAELASYLADENIKQRIDRIELVGLCTDICVISNAMLIKAFLPNTKIVIDRKSTRLNSSH